MGPKLGGGEEAQPKAQLIYVFFLFMFLPIKSLAMLKYPNWSLQEAILEAIQLEHLNTPFKEHFERYFEVHLEKYFKEHFEEHIKEHYKKNLK